MIKIQDVIEVEFIGRVIFQTGNNGDWKAYAIEVDKEKYPNIKFTKYGNCSINGEMHELAIGQEYKIIAVEKQSSYGISYKVINIKRDKPTNKENTLLFLQEILTHSQADTLYNAYPNIIDKVINNDLDDMDLQKTKGIKEYTFDCIKKKIIENYVLVELVDEFQEMLSLVVLKKMYNKYSSVKLIRKKMREEPYKCLCGLSGIGFKTADNILLELDRQSKDNIEKGLKPIIDFSFDLRTSSQRCLAAIIYLLEENENNGHTKMDIIDLKNQIDKLVPACSQHIIEGIKSKYIYFNKDYREIALKNTYETEEYLAKTLKSALNNNTMWGFDYLKYKNQGEFELSDEQLEALRKLCIYNVSILNGAAGCVDCDTEFFNGIEWKKISKYSDGDLVLQYNKNGVAELVKPLRYIKQKNDMLYQFDTKYGLDQCLSLNHSVPYVTSRGNIKIKSFKEIKAKQEDRGFRGKFITSFEYDGSGIDLSDNEIRLMIAIFADGHFPQYVLNKKSSVYKQVRFNLKKKRKKQRLENLLNQLKINYEKKDSVSDGFHTYFFTAPFILKHFPTEWYRCSQHQLKVIAEEVMYWDGRYKTHNNYTTVNKKDADFVQFVFSSLGYRSSIRTGDRIGSEYTTNCKKYIRKSIEYQVSYTNRNLIEMCNDNRSDHKKTEIKPYPTLDGYEYCFTVPSHMLILRRNNKIFITGNCGKSASTEMVIKMLQDNNKTFSIFAPTGRASKVIAEYTKQPTATIHRGLGYQPPNDWNYNEENKLKVDVVIIDEFSMTDIFLCKHLFEAIDFSKTKLLIIGDNAQLPSVACGNLLHDFMQSKIIPTTTLTKVFRYGEGGLMTVATDVRNGKLFLKKDEVEQVNIFGDNKDYTFLNFSSKVIVNKVIALYKKLLDKGYTTDDILVLSPTKKGDYGTPLLNNKIQKIANKNITSEGFKVGDTTYYLDDIVMQTVNNYKAKLYIDDMWGERYFKDDDMSTAFIANGEIGKIIEMSKTHIVIDFDSTKVIYGKDQMQNVSLGYAITVHKSQGSNTKIVILLTPQANAFMLNSNLIYVGLTRMKEKCYHLGSISTVNKSIKKKANFNRKTFMQRLLKEVRN